MVVLITDGRANISLAKSNEEPEAMEPDAPKPTAVSRTCLHVGAAGGGGGVHIGVRVVWGGRVAEQQEAASRFFAV